MASPLVDRFVSTFNAHDLDGFLACFRDDYRSESPQHPARGFGGRAQVRENWARVFAEVPDVRIDVSRSALSAGELWMEYRIHGTRSRDGTRLDLRGVGIHGVRDGAIAWARLYVEEVEESGADIRATVGSWVHALRGV